MGLITELLSSYLTCKNSLNECLQLVKSRCYAKKAKVQPENGKVATSDR